MPAAAGRARLEGGAYPLASPAFEAFSTVQAQRLQVFYRALIQE